MARPIYRPVTKAGLTSLVVHCSDAVDAECWQGNLVGAEDAEDSDVEIAPDDHELNYDEQMAGSAVDQLSQVNSVFNERHVISESQVVHSL